MLLLHGDSRVRLGELADWSVDSVVCDPPYELGFMGKSWDASGVAYDVGLWGEVLRVLKPGGHLLAFGGSRTYHRLACAVEDAGFEIRDQIMWVHGLGFPKSFNISKGIDRSAGAEREIVGHREVWGRGVERFGDIGHEIPVNGNATIPVTAPATDDAKRWDGWGTALKPAHEPVVVARKPMNSSIVANVIEHGTGAINIAACRVESETSRWPANLIHDGSDDVLALFPEEKQSKLSAARFFYCAKASKSERNGGLSDPNHHPTVKPIALMRYLCRLVTPPGGTVLDPFLGSGTTGIAATLEGFDFIGIEQDAKYLAIAEARIKHHTPDQ
jgi:site-specific DNA-methyltransferase (adenine-specific)